MKSAFVCLRCPVATGTPLIAKSIHRVEERERADKVLIVAVVKGGRGMGGIYERKERQLFKSKRKKERQGAKELNR